jgi:hypothetical protein
LRLFFCNSRGNLLRQIVTPLLGSLHELAGLCIK